MRDHFTSRVVYCTESRVHMSEQVLLGAPLMARHPSGKLFGSSPQSQFSPSSFLPFPHTGLDPPRQPVETTLMRAVATRKERNVFLRETIKNPSVELFPSRKRRERRNGVYEPKLETIANLLLPGSGLMKKHGPKAFFIFFVLPSKCQLLPRLQLKEMPRCLQHPLLLSKVFSLILSAEHFINVVVKKISLGTR